MEDEKAWNYCPKCGMVVDETHEVKDRLEDGTEAEYFSYCKECGEYLYFFCYGSTEY